MSKKAIINGELFLNNKFRKGIILINNDKIEEIILKSNFDKNSLNDYEIIDASNSYVSYGFFEPHCHIRFPGAEHKETWESGSKAAIHGGFTFIMDMPNNNPGAVNLEVLTQKNDEAKKTKINYGFYIGLTDENSLNLISLYNNALKNKIPVFGIKAFLGSSTGNLLIKDEFSITRSLKTGLITLFHCEDDETLKEFDSIPYKTVSDHSVKRPPIAEVNSFIKVSNTIKKVKGKKPKAYICHISSKELVKSIEKAKKRGFSIISEVSPNHLFFSLENIGDSNIFKVNPPIRSEKDRKYLVKKFNEGFFDILGTDHAPHLLSEKLSDNPPSGMPGLETCFYSLYSLYEKGEINLKRIFQLLTSGYNIFKMKNRGEIKKGNYADLVIIKKTNYTVKAVNNFTLSGFTQFEGLTVGCKIDKVFINGNLINI